MCYEFALLLNKVCLFDLTVNYAATANDLVSNSDLCLLFVKEIQNSTTKHKHQHARKHRTHKRICGPFAPLLP